MSIARYSQTLAATLRDDPQDAEIASHKLMVRAGLIRKLAGGLYTFLPLGRRALLRVEALVREEMDRSGAQEILMPALQPREIWEQSGRYATMGDVMFRLRDRQKREFALGPTHEEVVTLLAAAEIKSYRQLPRTLYQIQTKFRDEIRPRFGLMRAKEFIMKDAYSFDRSWDAADESYRVMYEAYLRFFARCGMRVKAVEADTGAMGGQWSHEFMVLAEAGEDGLVECDACAYAANVERAERAMPDRRVFPDSEKALEEVATPDARSIERVARFLQCDRDQLVKTLLYQIDGKTAAVLAPGDREINEHKLARALGAQETTLADDETIEKTTGGPVGFCGPVGLDIPVYADAGLQNACGLICGANRKDTHLLNLDIARDTRVTAFHDLCSAREGDACPRCAAGKLREKRGIEVGHVFKLGSKYTEAFSAQYLDENGRAQTLIMGCYGIGVSRVLQAVVEQSHDANGIVWPMSVAPYPVALLTLNPDDPTCDAAARTLAAALDAAGVDVFVDDRDERPGIKFADADLMGFPIRVVISKRSLAQNSVEIKMRAEKSPFLVAPESAAARIAQIYRDGLGALNAVQATQAD
jgi:prolyl-tRNA synthetase